MSNNIVRHRRSGDLGKRPAPIDLETGQIAINYNALSPGMYFKTDSGTLIKVGPPHIGAEPPVVTGFLERSIGESWVDISNPAIPVLKIWTLNGWITVSTPIPQTSVFIPPTSPAGLPIGAVWNNNGVLTIVG